MKRLLTTTIILLLMTAPALAAPTAPPPDPQIKQLQEVVQQLQQQNAMLQALAKGYSQQASAEQDTIAQLRADILVLQSTIQQMQARPAPPASPPRK